ncbi:MAG: excinuclease ABC subunit UvrA [Chloroflexi bacterium]|nr:excinuclease ABC subunit UvrA [Chloroflexota bacterium]
MRKISVRGASENNLQGLDLDIPHEALTVISGLSGSGKSSLAFDTIFREGQRRYIESLSSYARQFLGQMERPRVDHIEGLSPAAAIDQRSANRNPRSTVGTITEVSDYLRLLFARIGQVHCHRCDTRIRPQTVGQIVDHLLETGGGELALILAPVVRHRKGEHTELIAQWRRGGYVRARFDGVVHRLDEAPRLARTKWHDIEVVVDRIRIAEGNRERITDSVETATELADGMVISSTKAGDELLSSKYGCPGCGASVEPPEPASFSFNSRRGSCRTCQGLGRVLDLDPDKLIRDPDLSIRDGAIALTNNSGYTLYARMPMRSWERLARAFDFSIDTPWKELSDEQRDVILYGSRRRKSARKQSAEGESGAVQRAWRGLIPLLRRRSKSGRVEWAHKLVSHRTCQTCNGARLRAESLSVRFQGLSIAQVNAMPVAKARAFLKSSELQPREARIADQILHEIDLRLDFLERVGLSYLTLDRSADSLAGGEAQRIRLAAQIGAGLEGVLYVLDEPSVGLHHRDNAGLLRTLGALRSRGNTVLVVEHDESTIRSADHVVDIGPAAGDEGGLVVAEGSPDAVAKSDSPTGRYLRGADAIPIPKRRPGNGRSLSILGAGQHNLKNIDVAFPLGMLICVTGVSGSGKSTLVDDILKRALAAALHGAQATPGLHDRITGIENVEKVIEIDQSPIGRNPRSNPATYSGVFDHIRDLFHKLPEARARGYRPGRFSFNVKGGRCEACEGRGALLVEMQFMGDVEIVCEACGGSRFNRQTLGVRYKGKSIADVLALRVSDALEFFENIPRIHRILQTMVDVGLGYVPLGQSSTTLSGGEAQRLKLSSQLARPPSGHTLYILDEPTTGLHFYDVKRLVDVLQRLVDGGNTVIVVEHNPEIIKITDWVIDLGPEGGDEGGSLVAAGTPEDVALARGSHTGEMLAEVFAGNPLGTSANGATAPSADSEEGVLTVVKARKHNLKSVSVKIPKEKLTVVTGVSGSGKSTLAMETIFSEGQRRFVECLSSYARQFLGRLEDAEVESISGLAPAIAIGQENLTRTPRSLVATATEIYDYLRVLYSRAGRPHCPNGHGPIAGMTSREIIEAVANLGDGNRINIITPASHDPEDVEDPLAYLRSLLKEGFVRVRIGGRPVDLSAGVPSDGGFELSEVELVVDRLVIRSDSLDRLGDSVELALARGGGRMFAEVVNRDGSVRRRVAFSSRPICAICESALDGPLTPRHFSFNAYTGACPACDGLGSARTFDRDLVVPDPSKSYAEGAIAFLDSDPISSWWGRWVMALAEHFAFDPYMPWSTLPEDVQSAVLYGTGDTPIKRVFQRDPDDCESRTERMEPWEGFIPIFARWYERTRNTGRQDFFESFMREQICEECGGARLQPMVRSVRFVDKTVSEVLDMSIAEAKHFFKGVADDPGGSGMSGNEAEIAETPLIEITNRLQFLDDVGVGYLTLNRPTASLSGGEAQRIRLATQVGTRLVGALYVLDEPSIGLHPRDIGRLLSSLKRLRDLGNTVIVIEHDEETMRMADHLIDLGPGPGERGGQVVAEGTLDDILESPDSITGQALRHDVFLHRVKMMPRMKSGDLEVIGARANNLKNIDVAFPVGCFTAVTGVSGSGKSTLVDTIVRRALRNRIHGAREFPGEHSRIEGAGFFSKVVVVDQSPIGRSARSCPATYIGVFDEIRALYARLPDAKALGFGIRRFSFNEGPGKCPACRGEGYQRISMQFLADVQVLCDACGGKRYNAQTRRVKFRGLDISDILELSAEQALEHFDSMPRIRRYLQVLCGVGLGYIRLGQAATGLSGGEAQRIKLAAELSRSGTGDTLYLLDEPTVGLHAADVKVLVDVLDKLVEEGNTVVVVEHDLGVIAQADHVIDLGPEGGDAGGYVVASGTPKELSKNSESYTGLHLRRLIDRINAAA